MIFDANEMHTMMDSMNKNMQNKIQDIDELKSEITGLIQEDRLQGLAYNNGKHYFQLVWLPLLEGVQKMCSSTIQGNKRYMQTFHQQVDGSPNAYIDTDYLEEGIERLNYLRRILENDIEKPKWFDVEMYDNIFETRQLQNMIERLTGFDAMAGSYYDDARFYYQQVKSGMDMLSKGTWDEASTNFKMDITQMGWVGNIHNKKGKEKGEAGSAFGMWEGIKKFMLKAIQKEQAKLLKEYWDASEERKTEIVDKLRKNTSMKQMFTDYTIHMDDWQLRILGWSEKDMTKDFMKKLNETLETNNINSVEQMRHFISQVSHESKNGVNLIEIGSEEYISRNGYSGGPNYRGAGYIQLTHDYNYENFGNFVNDPEVLKQGYQYVANNYAWETAGWFWSEEKNLDELIDANISVEEVTRKVNGGILGLDDRERYYEKACKIIY